MIDDAARLAAALENRDRIERELLEESRDGGGTDNISVMRLRLVPQAAIA